MEFLPVVPSTDYKTDADYDRLVRQSLTNLQTDYIDMFLLHWPGELSSFSRSIFCLSKTYLISIEGVYGLPNRSKDVIKYRHAAWKALSRFQKDGLIRSIGVSNFMIKHLEDLKRESEVVPALNQVEWHPRNYNDKLLDYCKDNNILLQAYSSLGTSHNTSLRHDPTVAAVAEKLNKSSSQILLRWATQKGVAIIPKASSKEHLVENMNLDFTIPEEEMTVLDAFPQSERFDWNPNDVI